MTAAVAAIRRCGIAILPTALALAILAVVFHQQWQHSETGDLHGRIALITDEVVPAQAPRLTGDALARLEKQLRSAGIDLGAPADLSTVLKAQQWLGNLVQRAEAPSPGNTTAELLPQIEAGRGLTCGGMATVFHDVVIALGMPVRRVQLYRSNSEPLDTHVLLEVRLANGRWIAVDPTFNLTFKGPDDRLLGIGEIRELLTGVGMTAVTPVYHGDRAYPGNIDTYYLDWRVLFANAYVMDRCAQCRWLERVPPLKYWTGPVRYVYGKALGPLAREHNLSYFNLVVVLPLVLALLAVGLIWQLWRCGRG